MKTIKSNEEAVSPVIGVILMVAIVVILAAVIAAFVFGMAGSTATTKVVGLIVTANGTNAADIVWQGGSDIDKISAWAGSIDGVAATNWSGTAAPKVGSIYTTGSSIIGKRVIVNATFQDGSAQVIFDRKY